MPGPKKPEQENLKKQKAADEASSSLAKPEDKKLPLLNLPKELLAGKEASPGVTSSFLDSAAKSALTQSSKRAYALFQPQLRTEELTKHVAYGEQKEADAMLEKAQADPNLLLRLLKTKNPVTDCSGHNNFTKPKLTPFQYAFWAKDQHMLKMLELYLPKDEQARQLKELRDNKVKYGVVLMTIDSEQKLDAEALSLRRISSQTLNKPVLIKQGENLHLYGYDFLETAWKLTPLDPKVFKDKKDLLAFPQRDPFADYELRVLQLPKDASLPVDKLPPGTNSAYVLVQEAAGVTPSALYFVDRSGAEPSIKELSFPINQNISTFTRALYPAVTDDNYIDKLSPEQLQAITLTTGHPLTVVDETTLTEDMYEELAKGHTQGTEHGMHYDFSRLQVAIEIYLENFDPWSAEQCSEYWKKMVGGAQDVAPGHVRDEYCRLDRAFYPLPSFDEPSLPRGGRLYNNDPWYSREGSGLSSDFAVYRGGAARGAASWGGVRAAEPVRGLAAWPAVDLAAVSRLCEVRTEYVATLTQQLLNPAPSAAP